MTSIGFAGASFFCFLRIMYPQDLICAAGELGLFGGAKSDVVFSGADQFIPAWVKVQGNDCRCFVEAESRGIGVGGPCATCGHGLFCERSIGEATFFPAFVPARDAVLAAVYA